MRTTITIQFAGVTAPLVITLDDAKAAQALFNDLNSGGSQFQLVPGRTRPLSINSRSIAWMELTSEPLEDTR